MTDTITDRAVEVLKRQEAKGLRKYGATLDGFTGTPQALLDHAIEEAADQLVYLLRARELLPAEHSPQKESDNG